MLSIFSVDTYIFTYSKNFFICLWSLLIFAPMTLRQFSSSIYVFRQLSKLLLMMKIRSPSRLLMVERWGRIQFLILSILVLDAFLVGVTVAKYRYMMMMDTLWKVVCVHHFFFVGCEKWCWKQQTKEGKRKNGNKDRYSAIIIRLPFLFSRQVIESMPIIC